MPQHPTTRCSNSYLETSFIPQNFWLCYTLAEQRRNIWIRRVVKTQRQATATLQVLRRGASRARAAVSSQEQ